MSRENIKFIPEEKATEEEIEAFKEAREERKISGTISHNDINWN